MKFVVVVVKYAFGDSKPFVAGVVPHDVFFGDPNFNESDYMTIDKIMEYRNIYTVSSTALNKFNIVKGGTPDAIGEAMQYDIQNPEPATPVVYLP